MRILNRLRNILAQTAAYALLFLSKVYFFRSKQRIWLVTCDQYRWGDNADAFWRYMNRKQPMIRTIAIANNKPGKNMNKSWVRRNSFQSYLLILQAEVLAVTHRFSDVGPNRIVSLAKGKKVWLQHGIIAIGKNLVGSKARSDRGVDLICASSDKEKQRIVEIFGIDPRIVSVTGLARHDVLIEKTSRGLERSGILYIPTSRRWLVNNKAKCYDDLLFSWIGKINDSCIDTEIRLWIHPGWYEIGLGNLGSAFNNVDRYSLEHDPQELICESKLMITDYSSTFFDAVLSGIPAILYQPDRSAYIEQIGLFEDFIDQDLLLVVEDEDELLRQIELLMNNSEYYSKRLEKDKKWALSNVDSFDGRSCQRIYEEINNLL